MNKFVFNVLTAFASLAFGLTATTATLAHGPDELATQIEHAHGADAWRSKDAVKFHADVSFGGNKILDAVFIYSPHQGKTRMELANGAVAVFDGEKAWITPADTKLPYGARFHLLTWPYFLAAPFKLNDPGSTLSPWTHGDHNTAKLTFDAGVGDTPDDWYIVYQNPKNRSLDALAYIVTYGTATEKAEQEPHAVRYQNLVEIDGVKLATEWSFFLWTTEKGIHGDPIGAVKISDIEFVTPKPEQFVKPEAAREAALPPSP